MLIGDFERVSALYRVLTPWGPHCCWTIQQLCTSIPVSTFLPAPSGFHGGVFCTPPPYAFIVRTLLAPVLASLAAGSPQAFAQANSSSGSPPALALLVSV